MHEDIYAWFDKCASRRKKHKLGAAYHQLHPKITFLKSLPSGARFFDAGAGDGSMALFKKWLEPKRKDISMWALSLKQGQHHKLYDRWLTEFWTPALKIEPMDAVFASHFIEHLEDPFSFLRWASDNLRPGGRMYLEWPSPTALDTPKRLDIEKQCGVLLPIGNYYDDSTHRLEPLQSNEVASALRQLGFAIETESVIAMPYFEDKLLEEYYAAGDIFLAQAAFWLKTGWCQYIVATKPA